MAKQSESSKVKSHCFLVIGLCLSLAFSVLTAENCFAQKKSSSSSSLPKAGDFVEVDSADSAEDSAANEETAAAPEMNPDEAVLTGTVRVMRKLNHTEVFFKDLKDSYIIPSGNSYYSLYKAFNDSEKTGSAVSFKANTKARRVLSLADGPASPATTMDSGKGTGSSNKGNK